MSILEKYSNETTLTICASTEVIPISIGSFKLFNFNN